MSSSNPDPLKKLLDAAGRELQPTIPGWQTLPARLVQTPQLRWTPLGRWGTAPIGAAAVGACLLVLLGVFLHRQALVAQERPIEVRRQGVDLTVLSVAQAERETLYMPVVDLQQVRPLGKQLRGQALVKDRQLVLNLKAGDNVVKFTDIAATIDPTSVHFESLTDPTGTTVVEQSFEYDLATADALLKRFIDREIVCIDKAGQEIAGTLASYDGATMVLAKVADGKDRSTQNVSRQSLAAVRLAEMPADLIVKPTLVWRLRTKMAGKHETLLSYICGFVKWQANYVIEVTPGEAGRPDLLDVNAWVTLENTSGAGFPQAGLRLIAGDVQRVKDPWALYNNYGLRSLPPQNQLGELNLFFARNIVPDDLFEGRSFFEYHLYALKTLCTIADRQIKQLSFFRKKGVKAVRRYVFDPNGPRSNPTTELMMKVIMEHERDYTLGRDRNLTIQFAVKNEKENELGLPLPKGIVTLQQRGSDGELAAVGQTAIDHTAIKEELKLRYGHAIDVVGQHREVQVESIGKNQRSTYEIRIRNHKPTAVPVKCYAVRLSDNAELRQASLPHLVEDAQTIYFEFTLAGNGEQVIRYTVVYRGER